MKLIYENVQCTVVEAEDEEWDWLDELLSYPVKQFHRGGRRDSRRRLLVRDSFASGYLPQVVRAAREVGYRVQIADKRITQAEPVAEPVAEPDLAWLRPYQVAAVQRALTRKRGVLWCPTGAGKTEIAIGLVKSVPVQWLLLAHRTQLVHQAAERYHRRTGEEAGLIGEGAWAEGQKLTCATFQTLYARIKAGDSEALDFLRNVGGVIVDEVHTLPASSFGAVVNRTYSAAYRIGLSGTPLLHGDERSQLVIGATGPVVFRITAQELIDAGVLAKPIIRMVRCAQTGPALPPPPPGKKTRSPKVLGRYWAQSSKALINNSDVRNGLLVDMVERAEKPCLLFVNELEHGKTLERLVRERGMNVEFIAGNKVTPQRMAAIKRLEYGDTEVLICTVIFNEGVDIPELRSVVVGSSGKSAITALQRVGRGTRRVDGKNEFEVWDVLDEGNLLAEHAVKRRKAYDVEGYEVHELDSLEVLE